jgi:hypothetical protein
MIHWQPSSMAHKAKKFPISYRLDHVLPIQQGHAARPFVLHPDKAPYAGKSFIVHIKAARIVKLLLEDAS